MLTKRPLILGASALLFFGQAFAEQTTATAEEPATENHEDCPKDCDKKHWMDSSHEFVTTRTDQLANWLDGFFGVARTDLESPQSFLRLRLENEWDEIDGNSVNVRLRGKVRLPRISERVGLIFSDQEGDEQNNTADVEQVLLDENSKNDIALQYTGFEKLRSRLDFKIGLRSNLKLKTAARYRHEIPFNNDLLGRFSEEFYFRDGEGFGTYTQFDLDKTLSNDRLLRWSNNLKYGEETFGAEWGTYLSLAKKLSDKDAISYFVGIDGHTRPSYLTKGYGLGVTYRRNFFRKWLFFEIEPAYAWRRLEVDDDREGGAILTGRLEIIFDKEHGVLD
jgi:hypothetical protein